MLITEESELNLAGDEMTWVVDSGALFHLTPDEKCFSSYTAGDHNCVRMGNEGTCWIVGIGDVWLSTPTGCKMLLKDVRHVPEVRLNLILAGRLDDEGYMGSIRNDSMKFSQGEPDRRSGPEGKHTVPSECPVMPGRSERCFRHCR